MINDLAPKIEMTALQFKFTTAIDVFETDADKFNREFGTQLTWKQIKEFRSVMEPLFLDIVERTKVANKILSNNHPLLAYYQKALDCRSLLN